MYCDVVLYAIGWAVLFICLYECSSTFYLWVFVK